ncbi:hypothetical protein [Kineosporia sp. R_H_3]|uniref:hypothetical protein n=1 Tax=Kineosporia sp. R_H_3 TaxID=1961848 RepID=UPI000B4ACA44|nr:hypothetical protein [Kineosporia sp. R_H_3]
MKAPTKTVTLGISCPVHGVQAAPAATVLIARRVTPTVSSWTVTGPCPVGDCSIAVVLPAVTGTAGVSLAYVARLNAAGARLIDVHPGDPATDIVPIAVPSTVTGGGAA